MQKTTIELKHKNILQNYKNEQNSKEELSNEYEMLKNAKSSTIKESIEIKKRIKEIKNKIELLDSKNEEIDYLLKVVPILNKYNETDNIKHETDTNNQMQQIKQTKGKEKGTLYNEFMNVVDNTAYEIIKNENIYQCPTCNVQKVLAVIESSMICPICGVSDTYFDTGINNLSYEQEINSEGNICFSYKKMNHFSEWLAQFQAKESIDIPEEVLENLRNEFHKMKLKHTSEITKVKVKQLLKKLKYNKYYEHVTHITNLLTGQKPPSISLELEETLRNMFRDIQDPFEQHKPKERSNFLSYSYCLYKFCELLGHDELLCNFPLLKSREKLHQQDVIWKKICNTLSWQYIATV